MANIGRTDPPQFRLTTRIIRNSYHWLTDPAGIFVLRMVVVTIATAIPGSLPHTAGFFYREKGLWGVITAQIAYSSTWLTFCSHFAVVLPEP